jgi:aryl-alcohol dehydrogenase-like predicted oxidoreductase
VRRSPRYLVHAPLYALGARVLDTVRELGIAFVAYSPLGRGFLTGRFQKFAFSRCSPPVPQSASDIQRHNENGEPLGGFSARYSVPDFF